MQDNNIFTSNNVGYSKGAWRIIKAEGISFFLALTRMDFWVRITRKRNTYRKMRKKKKSWKINSIKLFTFNPKKQQLSDDEEALLFKPKKKKKRKEGWNGREAGLCSGPLFFHFLPDVDYNRSRNQKRRIIYIYIVKVGYSISDAVGSGIESRWFDRVI